MDSDFVNPFDYINQVKNSFDKYTVSYDGSNLIIEYWSDDTREKYSGTFDHEYLKKKYNLSLYNILSIVENNAQRNSCKIVIVPNIRRFFFSYTQVVKMEFTIDIPLLEKNDNELIKKVDMLTNEIKHLKENASLVIGHYWTYNQYALTVDHFATKNISILIPITFFNPYKECDIFITFEEKLNIRPTNMWSEERQIIINHFFNNFTELFKIVNCNKLIIKFPSMFERTYDLWENLPLSLKIIEFRDPRSFKEFLKNYDNSRKNLYKIILNNVCLTVDSSYNILLLKDCGIKEIDIIKGDIKNLLVNERIKVNYISDGTFNL